MNRWAVGCVWIGCAWALVGCGGSSVPHHDHAHDAAAGHAHPETFADGVGQLAALRDRLREAFAKQQTAAADELLHDVGHLLEEVSELAEHEKLSPADVLAVKGRVQELTKLFAEVDKTLHGEPGKPWSEVAPNIDAAIAQLVQQSTRK